MSIDASPGAPSSQTLTQPQPFTRRRRLGAAAWMATLALACVATIQFPLPAAGGLDDSWQLILAQAFLEHLSLGRDLVFTFGPLGALENRVQLPELFWPQVMWQLGTRLAVVVLMAFWMRKSPLWVGTLTFSAMIFLSGSSVSTLHAPATDAFYMLALWVAAAVLIVDGARSALATALSIAILAAFALTKVSLTVAAIAGVFTAAGFHCVQRRFGFAAILIFSFGATCLAGWLLKSRM